MQCGSSQRRLQILIGRESSQPHVNILRLIDSFFSPTITPRLSLRGTKLAVDDPEKWGRALT